MWLTAGIAQPSSSTYARVAALTSATIASSTPSPCSVSAPSVVVARLPGPAPCARRLEANHFGLDAEPHRVEAGARHQPPEGVGVTEAEWGERRLLGTDALGQRLFQREVPQHVLDRAPAGQR